MTSRTGANTYIGVAKCGTFGTAGTCGAAGKKMEVESLTFSENATELSTNPIGSGADMQGDAVRGGTSPSITINCVDAYENPQMALEALFFGNSATPMSMGDSTYCHSMIYNATRNPQWATVAFHSHSAGVFEIPSALPSRVSISASNPPDYVRKTIELLGDRIVLDSTVNTYSSLLSATLEDTNRQVVRPQDYFWINAQAGDALATGDKVDITSITIDYSHPIEHVREIRGAATSSNSEPRSSGSPPFECTVTITLRSLDDLTYFTAQAAGTEYKAQFTVTDADAVGGSNYYYVKREFPRLKIIQWPDYSLNNAGENPVTIVFKALKAASNPTGMISTMPYVLVQNSKSDALMT